MVATEGGQYQDLQGLVTILIHLHPLQLDVTTGITVMIIHLGNHSLHMVRTSGTTDQMVDLLAQMSSSVMYLHPIMDMVLQLMGKADKDLAPRRGKRLKFGVLGSRVGSWN
jgi:hypothetical protein